MIVFVYDKELVKRLATSDLLIHKLERENSMLREELEGVKEVHKTFTQWIFGGGRD